MKKKPNAKKTSKRDCKKNKPKHDQTNGTSSAGSGGNGGGNGEGNNIDNEDEESSFRKSNGGTRCVNLTLSQRLRSLPPSACLVGKSFVTSMLLS